MIQQVHITRERHTAAAGARISHICEAAAADRRTQHLVRFDRPAAHSHRSPLLQMSKLRPIGYAQRLGAFDV